MKDDSELLRRYAESRSETDFAALVERYVVLVYQAALRRTGGRSDLAQDAAQQVSTTLALEAPKLGLWSRAHSGGQTQLLAFEIWQHYRVMVGAFSWG